MIPTKAYILRINNPVSIEYAEQCAESCDRVGLAWEYFQGYQDITPQELWSNFPIPGILVNFNMNSAAACATASHFLIWKKIVENQECAVILEHDSLMLHPINIKIPDNLIVSLGYKFVDYKKYDYQSAGIPNKIVNIRRFSGAHAYTITYKTAEILLKEIKDQGVHRAIDNFYFMRINQPEDTESCVPLSIMMPTPAICWIRQSTIWNFDPSTLNYDVLKDFRQYYQQ